MFIFILALLGLQFGSANAVIAQTVAKVIGIQDSATLQRSGRRQPLVRNANLESGDRIRTDENGEVQIVFVDRTRVIIGPSSDFHVKDVKISAAKKASKFAVRALGGSFRFLSGDSPKKTYEIKTPSVTMGIRGTEFDFVVASRRQTRVVTFSGEVQVCNRRNRCARLIGGCSLVSVQRSNFDVPKTEDDRLDILARNFPFLARQTTYPRNFQVGTESCGDVEAAVKAVAEKKAAVPVAPVKSKKTRERYVFEGAGEPDAAPEPSAPEPAPSAPEPAPEPPAAEPEPQSYDEAADEA